MIDQEDYNNLYKLYFKNKNVRQFQNFAFQSYDNYIQELQQLLQTPENLILVYINDKKTQQTQQLRLVFQDLQFQDYPQDQNQILTPQMCLNYGKTYQSSFVYKQVKLQHIKFQYKNNYQESDVEIIKEYNILDQENHQNTFFQIPVLVGSKYCYSNYNKSILSDDNPAQYFIINGKAKIVIPFERVNTNDLMIYEKQGQLFVSVKSKSFIDKLTNINKLTIFVKEPNKKINKQRVDQVKNDFFDICVQIQQINQTKNITKNLSIFVLFYAFGVTNDKQIIDLCCYQDEDVQNVLKKALQNFKDYFIPLILKDLKKDIPNKTVLQESLQQLMIDFLEKNKLEKLGQKNIKQILKDNILPHVVLYQDEIYENTKKVEYLGFMTYNLMLSYLGRIQKDDRDSYKFKRCISLGQLMFQLTEEILKKKLKEIRKDLQNINILNENEIQKHIQKINNFITQNDFSQQINKALMTGKWSKGLDNLEGVSQTYKQNSMFQTLLQNRKISNNPTFGVANKTTKKTSNRFVDSSTLGYICSEESTEGENIGAVFTFAITADITYNQQDQIPILIKLFDMYEKELNIQQYNVKQLKNTKILIQGLLLYTTENPYQFIKYFQHLRQTNQIHYQISYYINMKQNYIYIYTDQGRYIRPVVIVENNVPKITQQDIIDIKKGKYKTFEEFVNQNPGKIHFLELNESLSIQIAENLEMILKNSHQHYNYVDMHPSVINGALSGSIYFFNHNPGQRNVFAVAQRKRAIQQQLHDTNYMYQKKVYNLLNGDRQVIRTIQSDALRLSKFYSGHQLKIMISTHYGQDQEDSVIFNEQSVQKLYLQQFEEIYEQDAQKVSQEIEQKFQLAPESQRNANYDYSKVGIDGIIKPGTIVYKNDVIISKVEIITQPNVQQQYYDKSVVYDKDEGIVVQVSQIITKDNQQKIQIKIRNYMRINVGDKLAFFTGGCKATCSQILPANRMPYFENGVIPDMLFNIHSLATRRSLGLLFEGNITHTALNELKIVDGSAFQNATLLLNQNTYEYQRYDPMQMRFTGKVLMALSYYQLQEQKPIDKITVTNFQQGQKSLLMRSYVSGKQGSIKYLESMSASCFLAAGCSFNNQQLMQQQSDGTKVFICTNCNRFSTKDIQSDIYYCKFCPEKPQQLTNISYSNIQIQRMLYSQGIDLRFIPQKTPLQLIQEKLSKTEKENP